MKYNFSNIINREGSASVKYELRNQMFSNPHVLPMWVADMDLAVPPFIMNALEKRLQHPILGYTIRNEQFLSSIAWWQKQCFKWSVETSWISYCPGIVAGLNHAVQAFTREGDKILIQTPVYHPFFSAVKLNKRELISNPLVLINGKYEIDFELFNKQIGNGVKMFILCNPHNPVGRVWTATELQTMASICLKNNVLIVSDEIHADLIYSPNKHIPIATLSNEVEDKTITFNAPSKSFNIAGLATAYAIIKNTQNLKRYNLQLERNGTSHGSLMGYTALQAAYTPEGELWLSELINYLMQNIETVDKFLKKQLPKLKLVRPEGTYLLWLDFREYGLSQSELNLKLINQAGLGFNDGAIFGSEGNGFQRMNIGCPQNVVVEALNRLEKAFA